MDGDTSAAALAASPAVGASSLYSISTHGSPVDEGKESARNDTTITKSLNSVKECISPSSFHSDHKFGGILANATTEAAAAAAALLLELASIRLSLFERRTERVAARTTTQVATGMIHLVMTVEVWIWGFSLLFPQALIPANSG